MTRPAGRHAAPPLTFLAGRRRPIDAVSVLTAYVVLMMVIPSLARFPPAGTIGSPSVLLAILMFVWWLWEQAHRTVPGPDEPQWVRRASILLLVVILVSFGWMSVRPLPSDEVTVAYSGLLLLVACLGVTLIAAEGVPNRERLDVLIRRMVFVGVLVGLLALVQLLTHAQWINYLVPPPLELEVSDDLGTRGVFTRPSGTAVHPLEFGAVMAMLIPLAITRARWATRNRKRLWASVFVLTLAAMISLSRSAIICTALAIVVLAWRWSMWDKLKAVLVGLVGLGVVALVIPGLIGTLRALFLGSGQDSSVQSRTDSYDYVFQEVGRFFWLGKGIGTFLPKYWILDNGYLNFLASNGVLGFGCLIAAFLAAFWSAAVGVRLCTSEKDREVAQAILAAAVAGASSIAFFDFFGFIQAAGTFFLILGLCGAVYRLGQEDKNARDSSRGAVDQPKVKDALAEPTATVELQHATS